MTMNQTVQPSLSAALQHRMNFLVSRQGVISGNVANAATPGYLTQDLKFRPLMDKASMQIAKTNSDHLTSNDMSQFGKNVTSKFGTTLNGNSVKLDEEMLKLSEVQVHYQMVTQLYAKHAQMQRTALGQR